MNGLCNRALTLCVLVCLANAGRAETVQPAETVVIDIFREAARAADPATLPAASGMPDTEAQTSVYGEVMSAEAGTTWVEVEQVAGDYGESVLAQWIMQSREDARDRGVRSLTQRQKRNLSHYFDDELLNEVRYRFDPGMELNTFASDIRFGEEGVTVLDDTVVFRLRRDSEVNLAMWAHALGYMQQYKALGVEGYARRHLREYPAMAAEASATMEAYLRAVQAAGEGKVLEFSSPPSRPDFSNQCRIFDIDLLVATNGDVYPHGQATAPGVLDACVFDISGEFSRYCVRSGGDVVEPGPQGWRKVGSCAAL